MPDSTNRHRSLSLPRGLSKSKQREDIPAVPPLPRASSPHLTKSALQPSQVLADKSINDEMRRYGRRELEISAPFQVVKNGADLPFLASEYQGTEVKDVPATSRRSPSKTRRALNKLQKKSDNDETKETTGFFGKMKDALSRSFTGSSSQTVSRYQLDATSSASILSKDFADSKKSVDSVVEDSPKLQRFFGADKSVKSAHRRTWTMDPRVSSGNATQQASEASSTRLSLADPLTGSPKQRPRTLMAVARDSYDEFASWAHNSIQAIGNEEATRSSALASPATATFDPSHDNLTSNARVTTPVPQPELHLLADGNSERSTSNNPSGRVTPERPIVAFSHTISGLKQHPNTFDFAEPPAWYTDPTAPRPVYPVYPADLELDRAAAAERRVLPLADSNRNIGTPVPPLPEITVKRASDNSKRSSRDAQLDSPPTLKKSKTSDDMTLVDALSLEAYDGEDFDLMTGVMPPRHSTVVERADSFDTMIAEPGDASYESPQLKPSSTGKLRRPKQARRKSLPLYLTGRYRDTVAAPPLPVARAPPNSRKTSGTERLFGQHMHDGTHGMMEDADMDVYDIDDEDELQMDQQPYGIGWAR